MDYEINEFVEKNLHKMQFWYMKSGTAADVIISASPRFLVEKFSEKTTGFVVIASEIDSKTGEFLSKNCYGEEKVRRFRMQFPEGRIKEFYSDSDSDMPMAKMAKMAYKVCGDNIGLFKI